MCGKEKEARAGLKLRTRKSNVDHAGRKCLLHGRCWETAFTFVHIVVKLLLPFQRQPSLSVSMAVYEYRCVGWGGAGVRRGGGGRGKMRAVSEIMSSPMGAQRRVPWPHEKCPPLAAALLAARFVLFGFLFLVVIQGFLHFPLNFKATDHVNHRGHCISPSSSCRAGFRPWEFPCSFFFPVGRLGTWKWGSPPPPFFVGRRGDPGKEDGEEFHRWPD